MKQLFTFRAPQGAGGQPAALLLGLGLLAAPAAAQTLTATSGATITVQSRAVLYVAGGVQNASGATLANAGTVQLTGDLANAGALTSTGTLLFGGGQDQAFAPGTATISSLTLANTGVAGSNRLFLAADLTVSSLLTLSRGILRTQGQASGSPVVTLSLPDGGRVAGEAAGQYVQGRLAVTRAAVDASTGSVDFTNGLVLNPNGQTLGAVTATRTAGLQAAGVSYGQNLSGTSHGIDRVWQVVTAQPPATPASVTLSWVADDDNGFNPATPAQLWRADQAAGPWAAQGAPASASARSFTANTAQLGVLTVSNTSAPLPVVLTSFTADPLGADALLKWTTASEKNNDYFEVEASADGRTFRPIGRVAGHGTTTQAHDYQLIDPAIAHYAADPVYYRLRQVDLDGTASYSPVRAVRVAGLAEFAAQLYPNPARSAEVPQLLLRTTAPGPARWELLDALGRTLASQEVVLPAGATTLPLAAAGALATGVYLVRVQQGAQRSTLKLVKE